MCKFENFVVIQYKFRTLQIQTKVILPMAHKQSSHERFKQDSLHSTKLSAYPFDVKKGPKKPKGTASAAQSPRSAFQQAQQVPKIKVKNTVNNAQNAYQITSSAQPASTSHVYQLALQNGSVKLQLSQSNNGRFRRKQQQLLQPKNQTGERTLAGSGSENSSAESVGSYLHNKHQLLKNQHPYKVQHQSLVGPAQSLSSSGRKDRNQSRDFSASSQTGGTVPGQMNPSQNSAALYASRNPSPAVNKVQIKKSSIDFYQQQALTAQASQQSVGVISGSETMPTVNPRSRANNVSGLSPPKPSFGVADPLVLQNYLSSNQMGASSSTQAMAASEVSNMSTGVPSRQQKAGVFSSGYKNGQESNLDRSKNINASAGALAVPNSKVNQYKNQRVQSSNLHNLPKNTPGSFQNGAKSGLVVSPTNSPRGQRLHESFNAMGSSTAAGGHERAVERQQFNNTAQQKGKTSVNQYGISKAATDFKSQSKEPKVIYSAINHQSAAHGAYSQSPDIIQVKEHLSSGVQSQKTRQYLKSTASGGLHSSQGITSPSTKQQVPLANGKRKGFKITSTAVPANSTHTSLPGSVQASGRMSNSAFRNQKNLSSKNISATRHDLQERPGSSKMRSQGQPGKNKTQGVSKNVNEPQLFLQKQNAANNFGPYTQQQQSVNKQNLNNSQLQSQGSKPDGQPITQNQVFDQLQSLIKNNKKHFGNKNQNSEEMVATLREFLIQMTDKNGDMPATYDSQTAFNQLMNELVTMNLQSNQAPGGSRAGKGMKNVPHRAQSLTNSNYHSLKGSINAPGAKGNGQQHGHVSTSKHSQASNASSNGSKKLTGPVLKQVKINKPVINLQINNNVQSVNNTESAGPLNLIAAMPLQSQGPAIQGNPQLNAQRLIELVSSVAQQKTVQNQSNQQNLAGSKQANRRNNSEDNVNQQLQMNAMRQQAHQNQAANQAQDRGNHRRTPTITPNQPRKNLPSLAGSRGTSIGRATRQSSNEPQMAIQIRKDSQHTNDGSSTYAHTAAGQHPSQSHYQAAQQLREHLNSSIQSLHDQDKRSIADSLQKRSDNSSAFKRKPTSGIAQPEPGTNSQVSSSMNFVSTSLLPSKQSQVVHPPVPPPTLTVDDTMLQEREKLITYIQNYIMKNNELPATTLDFYKFVKLIGKGAFGKVTLGIHKLTGKNVAIKTIEKSYMKDDFSKRKVFQEVYLLKKIKHSNVIRLLEVFESSKHLLMVMEYAGGGDLLKLIKKRGSLKEGDSKFIFKQIAYGLAHIHCRSVIHRDIKLDNILLDCEKGVKICDFGVSKIIKKGQVIQEQCGTPAYLAPEIILDTGYEGFFVDVWSLGVLLYAMLCGTVPFKAPSLEELHKLILKGEFTFPEHLSKEAHNIVSSMIKLNPAERATIPQVLSHPWLKETNEMESDTDEEEEDDEEHKSNKNDEKSEAKKKEKDQQKTNDIDLNSIQGNVNYVNVDNLFYHENYKTKLSYTDYCCITEDFTSENIDEEALKVCENFGFPRHFVIKCLNRGDINHATACYFLLTNTA